VSPQDDDLGVTARRDLDDSTADALLAGRDVQAEPALSSLMGALRALADGPAPAPSSALASLLEGGFEAPTQVLPVAPSPRSWRARTWALPLQLSMGVAAALGLILGAAAANELPAPAQTAVADVVEAVTPLSVPRPVKHPTPAVTPTPTPSASPQGAAADRHGSSPSPVASHDQDVSGTDGGHRDQQQADPSHSPDANPDDGGHSSKGGDDQPKVIAPTDRQPTGDSGDGHGSAPDRSGHRATDGPDRRNAAGPRTDETQRGPGPTTRSGAPDRRNAAGPRTGRRGGTGEQVRPAGQATR
jgi:hypothetical protein